MNAVNHVIAGLFIAAEDDAADRRQGYVTSHSWIWPETAEIIYGGVASVIIFVLLSGRPAR